MEIVNRRLGNTVVDPTQDGMDHDQKQIDLKDKHSFIKYQLKSIKPRHILMNKGINTYMDEVGKEFQYNTNNDGIIKLKKDRAMIEGAEYGSEVDQGNEEEETFKKRWNSFMTNFEFKALKL